MINFSNFTKLSLRKGQQGVCRTLKKSHTTTVQARTIKKETTIDLRAEFQQLLKETRISDEEMNNFKLQEENKIKQTFQQAQKDWEEKNESLKREWEEKRSNKKDDTNSNDTNKEPPKGDNGNGDKNDKEDKESENKQKKESKQSKNNKEGKPSENINSFSKFINGFMNVWRQTFPGEQNVDLIFENRKREAQVLKSKIKEATEEEITAIEADIPEWKRGALVLVSDQPEPEKISYLEIVKRNMAIHMKSLKIYQESIKNYEKSEVKLLVNDLKESYTNVKDNIKDSQNPFFVVSRDLIDKVPLQSMSALAINVMRKQDPDFDLLLFEKEVDAIFKQLMTAFVKDDLDTVKLLAGETALAVLTSEIRSRRERNIECKYKELLYIDIAQFMTADVPDEDHCIFRFRINTQEINCKVSRKDGKVVEGDLTMIENIHYIIDITRNPDPVIDEVGHPYLIVNLQRVGVTRQLL